MKQLRSVAAAAALLACGLAQAAPAGSIFVTEPGADGFNINTLVFNGSSYDIQKLTFDFSSSVTEDGSNLIIDGSPWSVVSPAGGSALFFGSGAVFGFDFTNFNTFDTFSFAWDPDSAISGSYGASSLDFLGATVTAVTTNGVYSGVFERVGLTLDVSAALAPVAAVPEPATYALTLGGLMVAGWAARRKSKQA